MSGDAEIAEMTDLAGGCVAIRYETNGNPFRIPTDDDMFSTMAETDVFNRPEVKSSRRLTLMQRTSNVKPRVPPCETVATRKVRSALTTSRDIRSTSSTMSSAQVPDKNKKKGNRERKSTSHEFREDKRDIYKLQLFINMKNRDLRKLEADQKLEEKTYDDIKKSISNMEDVYKVESNRIEAEVARQRKFADLAARTTSEKQKMLAKSLQDVQLIRSDIYKNEEALETVQNYVKFMNVLCPEETSLLDWYTHPDILLETLGDIETRNLMLIQGCQRIEELIDFTGCPLKQKIGETDEMASIVESIRRTVPIADEDPCKRTPLQQKVCDDMSVEYERVSELVQETYDKCFRTESRADARPLVILERIENELEQMYTAEDCIAPSFIEEKQAVKNKERREVQRRQRRETQETAWHRKFEQAVARSNKPTYRKFGRPVTTRILPTAERQKQDDRAYHRRLEQQREHNLLYVEDD